MKRLPVGTNADEIISIELDDVRFRVRSYWVPRTESWYVSIRSSAGTPLVEGLRCAVGAFPLRKYRFDGRPLGQLVVVDTSATNVEAGRDDYGPGKRVELIYLTRAELLATSAAVVASAVGVSGGGGQAFVDGGG